MNGLIAVRQREDHLDAAPWVLDRAGEAMRGRENAPRLAAVLAGLRRHPGVTTTRADAPDELVERTLGMLHERDYLDVLARVRTPVPTLLPGLSAPGLEPDTPVSAGLVASAREGVRTAITAAQRILGGGARAYALCRPPGHHAGPAWLGGYCYLNNAAAAAHVLREGGARRVGILDLDIHYPNGTSAIVAEAEDVELHSLHAWPVVNSPSASAPPRTPRETLVAFRGDPAPADYLDALRRSLAALSRRTEVLVLSLGYDTVAGDPHGHWTFAPSFFARIGTLVGGSGMSVCVIQEGGYAVERLADCSAAFATGLLEGRPA